MANGAGFWPARGPGGGNQPGAEQLFSVRLVVNGASRNVSVPARRLLSDCIRHDLRLTGTHVGCEHGVCGACTVLLDGAPVRSCLMLAVTADGAAITTVEGLARPDGTLSAVQQAFADCHGLQCGFCTPGFLTTITAALAAKPDPTPDEAREIIGGNLCRCTGYQNIVRAVLRAAELLRAGEHGRERSAAPHAGRADPGQGEAGRADPGQADPGQAHPGQGEAAS